MRTASKSTKIVVCLALGIMGATGCAHRASTPGTEAALPPAAPERAGGFS